MGGSKMPEVNETNVEDGSSSLSIVNTNTHDHVTTEAPIVSCYNDQIRPLLDTMDRLRNMNVMEEGIQLPTIVVVGDQSYGKSSVLESLARISLPRGDGICTRVPLVMRLQRSSSSDPDQIYLEYNGKRVETDEEHTVEAIRTATNEIAGSVKGVSETPLTLYVKKVGIPDLTMIDLPGISRVPVNGQPLNIHEQISAIIMKYIEPQESIILNVLSATTDFTTCESICMSQKVDKKGERTLAVVTKADVNPNGLLEKVTANSVNIGLGYVCVRNRVGVETYEEARKKEEILFRNHPLLSMIDTEMVGIPVLAQKLVQIQATMISRCLPNIIQKINDKLNNDILELNKLPMVMNSTGQALITFTSIIHSVKESLSRFLIRENYFEVPDDQSLDSSAHLADRLRILSDNLQAHPLITTDFLMDEINILKKCNSLGLPNFIPRTAFLAILAKRVDEIHTKPVEFIRETWDYIQVVLSSNITKHTENFPQIKTFITKASRNLISKIKEQSVNRVIEMVEMEKQMDYTSNPEYMTDYTQKIAIQASFITFLQNIRAGNYVTVTGFGVVEISHLRNYDVELIKQAFDIKMRITTYWTIVVRRIVDNLALYLQFSMKKFVNSQFLEEIKDVLVNVELEKLLEESPTVASKRERLKNSIKLLKESKDAVSTIIDR